MYVRHISHVTPCQCVRSVGFAPRGREVLPRLMVEENLRTGLGIAPTPLSHRPQPQRDCRHAVK